METEQPLIVWLLDVDGTILPDGSKPGWSGSVIRKVWIPLSDGDVTRERYAIRLVREIRDIIKSGLVDVQWATSWVNDDDVARLERLWSFPPLKRAFPSCAVGGMKEKTLAARSVIHSGRKLVWTDDTVVPQWGPLRDELTADGRSLLISPDTKKGLQPEDLKAIRDFVWYNA